MWYFTERSQTPKIFRLLDHDKLFAYQYSRENFEPLIAAINVALKRSDF